MERPGAATSWIGEYWRKGRDLSISERNRSWKLKEANMGYFGDNRYIYLSQSKSTSNKYFLIHFVVFINSPYIQM